MRVLMLCYLRTGVQHQHQGKIVGRERALMDEVRVNESQTTDFRVTSRALYRYTMAISPYVPVPSSDSLSRNDHG